jgi:putative CocE/NonD family hydrolase
VVSLIVDRHVWVPMPDGVRLAADVYRRGRTGRYPTVLLRTPYDRGAAQAIALQVNALRLAEAGFAVVVQDVRGRFASEGEFTPFVDEDSDGVASIDWAAEQRWSNGNVAMAGVSYCGYAQVLAARRRPEALRAWMPVICPLDVRDQWLYDGDAFALGFNLAWMLSSVALRDRRTSPAVAARLTAAFDDWRATVARAPDDQPAIAASPAAATWHAWLERRDDAAWWDAISGRGAGAHDAPALVVGGWFDVFSRGTFALHDELSGGAAAAANLLVGPWDHAAVPFPTSAGDGEFGLGAALDLPALVARWLDHTLRDGERPLPSAARLFVTGRNAWQDWPAWPPSASQAAFHTASGGRLLREVPAPAADAFWTDASWPTPWVGGRAYPRPASVRSGQVDQGARAARSDVLSYASEPFERETLVAGPVAAQIWSTTTPQGSDVAATLVDGAPGGRAVNVAEGVRRRLDAGEDAACHEIDLGNVAHAVLPGHRLRLDLAGYAFPRIDRLPANGVAHRTILHGGSTPSRLTLPLVA